jgi:catechol 2,3-dioxygenase-like lactoylglutathione lyase family enzyme
VIYEINHVAILVKDLDESVAFYQDVLGGTVVWRSGIESISLEFVYIQIGGAFIELLHTPDTTADRPHGIDHIAFLSDDLDHDFAALMTAGYQAQSEPRAAGSGVGRTAFVSDPAGARVELIQRDFPLPDESLERPIITMIDHVAVNAGDPTRSRDFYRDALGMDLLDTFESPDPGFGLSYLGLGSSMLELHHTEKRVGEPDFLHVALRVADVDSAVAELGIRPPDGTQVRQSGSGRVAVFTDPNGVTIELLDGLDVREARMPAATGA